MVEAARPNLFVGDVRNIPWNEELVLNLHYVLIEESMEESEKTKITIEKLMVSLKPHEAKKAAKIANLCKA